MLYRTRQPFSFNPFATRSPPLSLCSPPPHLQSSAAAPTPLSVEVEMERVEGVLKSSLSRPEMAPKKAHQQAVLDDLWAVNGQNGVSGDDFFVDDLLDFSKDVIEDEISEEKEEEETEQEKPPSFSVCRKETGQQADKAKDSGLSRSNLTVMEDLGPVPCNEFNVPAGDLEDLEWLSHFVEDSFSGYSLTYPAGKLPGNPSGSRSETLAHEEKPCFTTPVQTKARSKRARTGGRVWSLGSGSTTESSTTSSTSSSSTSSSPNSNPWLIYAGPSQSQTAESLLSQPPAKKRKKRPKTAGGGGPQPPRRCSHCLVQKTPQWRAGPLGAKTLCNACGVRYKSGRLLPEYRPACSPTFSSELHSNNHRKVLEMRRKKELEAGLAPPVQSF